MDRQDIYLILEEQYNVSHPSELPDIERWRLYEKLKATISDKTDYTKELITISEALDL